MKNLALIFLLALVYLGCGTKEEPSTSGAPAGSGILTPVKWAFSVNRISDTEAELVMKATIDKGWHVYAMHQVSDTSAEPGPISLTVEFDKSAHYELDGNIIEPAPKKALDPIFDMELTWFEDEAEYRQKIRVLSKEAFEVTGLVNFQTCDDEKCIPPTDEEFKFVIPGGA